MSAVMPKDILLRVGGRTMQRHGVIAVAGSRRGHGPFRPIETFTRADGTTPLATFVDQGGIMRKAAQHKMRIEWLDLDGDGVRETAIYVAEGNRVNHVLRSREAGNAYWKIGRAHV